MAKQKLPKLRTAERIPPPYPLNQFPANFALNLGKEIVYLLATRVTPRFEGPDWEEVFTKCIGGRWKPSNVGLDDVLLDQCAWSAKTVKNNNPFKCKKIRLISGRNSPSYSFDRDQILSCDPAELAREILSIWNTRVTSVKSKYEHLRTVILIKSEDLLELTVFEMDTLRYESDLFTWKWNQNKNLIGHHKETGEHTFTWQPHGSQFTIVEHVPENKSCIRIRQPPPLDRDLVLETMNFDPDWIEIVK
ncbi:MAG: hypothetical protein PF795_02425 [Kiritimatiellae bacterium]|nr:hypothetical protein [Kiritimatiellia bacterium]